MRSAYCPRPLGLVLLGLATACSHPNATGQEAAPATAAPRSVVTTEEIDRVPGRTIAQLLMDRFPGVLVTQASDGTLSIRIRGVTSLRGSNEPLYVVDDVPIEAGPGGALTGINPHDIASIEVVKDPAGMAQYGVRGANGVIIIKTKRPGQ